LGFWNNGVGQSVISNNSLSAGRWYHVVATRSGSTGNWTDTLYINGSLDATAASADDPRNPATPLTFIGWSNFSNQLFNGIIDDVHVYNRALSAAEIKQIYNAGR
jgi:Concanavalin A-like lectin/glucanases superfamily